MFGIDMMLKAYGIDPAEISKTAEGFATSIQQFVAAAQEIRAQNDRIEARLVQIQIELVSLRNGASGLPDLNLPVLEAYAFASPEQAYEMFTNPNGVQSE